ncbi:hypothetical protein F4810DRAFT_682771 [Camillea tinctor]|nr:hypothetical protein F4810DRAFT_682771 [Camillea tinctor]
MSTQTKDRKPQILRNELFKDLPLKELHTKLANPRDLVAELKEMIGEGLFKVEIRHDIYNIRTAKEFDIETLLKNCQKRQQNPNKTTTIKDNEPEPINPEIKEASITV